MFCRHGLCKEDAGDNGYCQAHGGRERLEREWEQDAARQEAEQEMMRGEGLSKFRNETPRDRDQRLEMERRNREKREAARKKRRKERLKAQPAKGDGGQQDKGGKGTSRKARQKAKKRHPGSEFYRSSNHGVAVKQKE